MDKIDSTAKFFPNVRIGDRTSIGEFSIIGKPYRLVNGNSFKSENITQIGKNCQIGCFVIIGDGTQIGDDSNIEDFIKTEQDVRIGRGCQLIYRTQICNEAIIGDNCIIAGFICERSKIGQNSRIFGKLIHSQHNPSTGWDDTIEPSPIIKQNAFIGFDAKIIGDVEIGEHAYVCAGAVVTKNVPPYHIACNVNQIIPYSNWKGCLLDSKFFKGVSND